MNSMKKWLTVLGTFGLAGCLFFVAWTDHENNSEATMYTTSGVNKVPVVTGNGPATVSGTYNSATRVLVNNSTRTNLIGPRPVQVFIREPQELLELHWAIHGTMVRTRHHQEISTVKRP